MIDRTIAPAIKPVTHLELLDAEKIELKNGIQFHLLPGGDQKVISLQLILPAGRWQESKRLQSIYTSALLKEGTKNKTANEVAEIIDFHGSHISVSPSYDIATVQLVCLTKHLQPMLDLLVEILSSPSFNEDELELQKQRFIQNLSINEEKGDYIAQRLFHEHLFGSNHPYGYRSTKEQYEAITTGDLKEFYGSQYSLTDGFVLLAGKFNDKHQQQIIDALEKIQKKDREADTFNYSIETTTGALHYDKKDSQQASIRIGMPLISVEHEDYQDLKVLNTVFGGYFGSRLMTNLREEKGYTYGAYSAIGNFLHQGYFVASTDVGVEHAANAVKEIYFEMDRLKNELISADELELVKNYMMGNYLAKIDGPFAQAKLFKGLLTRKRTAEQFVNRILKTQEVTPERMQELANTYFVKENLVEIVVG